MQELAAAFKLTNRAVLERIKSLEASGYLKGVLDDRGKYISLTEEEVQGLLKAVAKRGKMNRLEMTEEFSRVVRLEPTEADRAKIALFDEEFRREVERDFNSFTEERQMAN